MQGVLIMIGVWILILVAGVLGLLWLASMHDEIARPDADPTPTNTATT